ncbi:hypothetical protein EXS65_04055 [Candidatus Peribacteria bacterium]|nr:hypothetical protein [Candidatus Peribacteria bacterium]
MVPLTLSIEADEDTVVLGVLDDPFQALRLQLVAAEPDELERLLQREQAISVATEWTVNLITDEIQRRTAEAQNHHRDQLLSDPMTIEDLLSDPDYRNDSLFQASDEDAERLQSRDREAEPYDASSLHADEGVERIVTLSRSEETALVQYDGYSNIIIRIPVAPNKRDSLQELVFECSITEDIEQLATLLGKDIPVQAMRESSLWGSMQSGEGFDDFEAVIPMALEIVQKIDGSQHYRLPEVVWDRFGRYAQVQKTIDEIV